MLGEKTHRILFIIGFLMVLCGLPISKPVVSIGQFVLVGNFILAKEFIVFFERLKKTKVLITPIGLFFVALIWLFNTEDIKEGLSVLKRNLPLLILPITILSAKSISKKEFHFLLYMFLATLFVASFIGFTGYMEWFGQSIKSSRGISPFENPVRFSLMLALSSCILLFQLFNKNYILLNTLLIIWFVSMILLMESLTGIITLCAGVLFLSIKKLNQNKRIGLVIMVITGTSILYFGTIIFQEYTHFNVEQTKTVSLSIRSQFGEKYIHNKNKTSLENGNEVWEFIAPNELKESWNNTSKIPIDGNDKKNQPIKSTLLRYLTSKNLTKDKVGVSKLTEQDVFNIESGYTNYRFANNRSVRARIYETLWEIHTYQNNWDVNGNSLTLRFEYWKTGINIVKRHLWFGTGTGDYKNEFHNQYEIDKSRVSKKYRYLAHNQYLFYLINFGVIGFFLCVGLFFYPLFIEKSTLFQVFYLIVAISFLNETTLNSQIGVTFFASFFCFFVSSKKHNLPSPN